MHFASSRMTTLDRNKPETSNYLGNFQPINAQSQMRMSMRSPLLENKSDNQMYFTAYDDRSI